MIAISFFSLLLFLYHRYHKEVKPRERNQDEKRRIRQKEKKKPKPRFTLAKLASIRNNFNYTSPNQEVGGS